ncbi:uncharacterized protein LOC131433023 [Malaya genurostris]|uniref:uncharacterized protein LOC131433023 n=1 Tax=Malaya genurostris TaxID=325434 RepID=UPI0026F382DC|nr:uncharacterized protein LOC131433023 [Malaya genurostris]
MKHFLYIILISILLSKHYGLTHVIRKRQLFREQVLPHAGGKIPDSAFHTDRLALNQLQKEGIAVPDGVLLEQRRHQVFPHPYRSARPTFLVAQTSDGRYTSSEGHFGHNGIGAVDSTYAIPMPWEKDLYQMHTAKFYHTLPLAVPVFKELRIPQHSVFNFDYSNLKSKLQPELAQRPVAVHSTAPVVPSYNPTVSLFHSHSSKPSLSSPQNFVSYHAALGNLLNYQPAYAYGNAWSPLGVFHQDPNFLSHPLSSFEDFYGDPSGKQRYYRNVNHQEMVGSPGVSGGRTRQSRTSTSRIQQQRQALVKGGKTLPLLTTATGAGVTSSLVSSTRTSTYTETMLKLAFVAAAGLLCAVQCIKVDYYGSLYNRDELHAPYKSEHEEKQDFNKIPGVPGVDYPVYHEVPHTSFSCDHVPAVPGMYANVETGCQAYHTCHDGREGPQGASFLCTNGTVFNQKEFACDWWYNVKCEEAPSLYHLNSDPEHNPFVPKKKPEDELYHKKFLINV